MMRRWLVIQVQPPYALPVLDYQHGEAGRLIYDCEPYSFLGGGLCR